MKSMKLIKTFLLAVFAVMMVSVTVNAAALYPAVYPEQQNLNNGPVTLDFFSVSDETFEKGYIYSMTYTAPEDGYYNVTADGAMGLVLGYSYYYGSWREEEFKTYTNEEATFSEPTLAYKDDPYRSGAVCDLVFLEKGEEWTFSIIGKYFGSSFSEKATFKVNLIHKRPKITGVSVNKSTVTPGDTVTYSIVFDQNLEPWEVDFVDVSEYVYGPNGENIFAMSTFHKDDNYKVAGNTITYSYPVTADSHNEVVKMDHVYLGFNDFSSIEYANDTYRSWSTLHNDGGYIPGVPSVKFVTGNCWHNVLTGWLYTDAKDGKIYKLCELCDYKEILGVDPDTCTHSWDSGKVTKAATYDTEGVKTYTCTKCGETKTSAIAKLIPKKGNVFTIGEAKYKVTGSSTVSYVSTTSKAKKITIPSSVTIGGKKYSVTAIAAKAFKAKKTITSVTIPKTVITINAEAFYGCTSLKKITIPASVKKIGKKAFYNCKKLKTVGIKTKKLTSKTVGADAFAKINSSVTVKVPASKLKAYRKLLKKKGINGKKQKITK